MTTTLLNLVEPQPSVAEIRRAQRSALKLRANELCKTGLTLREIASELGVCRNTIVFWLSPAKYDKAKRAWRDYYWRTREHHRKRSEKYNRAHTKERHDRYLRWKQERLAKDPDYESKRHRAYREDHLEATSEYGKNYSRQIMRIWRAGAKPARNLVENRERGRAGEDLAKKWLADNGYEFRHLSAIWHPFPFDFLAEKQGNRLLIDATVTVSKNIRPAKLQLAKALGIEGYVLFMRPNGSFGHLEPINERENVVLPFKIIQELDKKEDF